MKDAEFLFEVAWQGKRPFPLRLPYLFKQLVEERRSDAPMDEPPCCMINKTVSPKGHEPH